MNTHEFGKTVTQRSMQWIHCPACTKQTFILSTRPAHDGVHGRCTEKNCGAAFELAFDHTAEMSEHDE